MNKGKNVQLALDAVTPENCYLIVADDDETWVDHTFNLLHSRLKGFENSNRIAHSPLIEVFIQLVGVLAGFSLCLIGASLLAPRLSIQYSFFVLLIGFFLMFSNLWTYILVQIGNARTKYWPYISFKRKPLGWIAQTVIGFFITLLLSGLLNTSCKLLKSVGAVAGQ